MRYRIGPLTVDTEKRAVFEAGRSLPIPPKVTEMLGVLCEQGNECVGKRALAERVWPDAAIDDSVLWQNVYLARKLLAPYLGPHAIETLARRGYRLTIPIEAEGPASSRPQRRAPWQIVSITAALVCIAAIILVVGVISRRTAAIDMPASREYRLGEYFITQGTYDDARKAEREFRSAIAKSHSPSAGSLGYAGLARAQVILAQAGPRSMRNSRLQAARTSADAAIQLDPESAQAYASLGMALLAMGRNDSAQKAFAAANIRDPENFTASLGLGTALLNSGDLRGAHGYFLRAIDLAPSNSWANVMAARTSYALGDVENAQSYAQRALAFGTPDEEDAYVTIGLSLVQAHRYRTALAAFHSLSRYSPLRARALIAYVEARMGARSHAKAELGTAAHASCNCAEFWMDVALTQLLLGDRRGADSSMLAFERSRYMGMTLLANDPRLAIAGVDSSVRSAFARTRSRLSS